MPDTTNDIDALLRFLDEGGWEWHHAALTALVAERNSLKQRVAELEANPPADRDCDLRQRLVCAALTAIVMAEASYADAAEGAVCYADATLAAMRRTGDPVRDLCGGSDCDLDGEKLVAMRKGVGRE